MIAMMIATPAMTAEWESRETPVVTLATTAKAAQVARMAWTSTSVVQALAATPGMYRKSTGALGIAARLRLHTRGYPEESAVPLEPGDNNREVRDADAQHGSDEPLKRMARPTRMR